MVETWTAEFYQDSGGDCPIERWLNSLDAIEFAAINAAIKHVLEPNGIELVRTEWLKALGGGLHEFRVRHSAAEVMSMFADAGVELPKKPPGKVLLRVFVHFHGAKVVLLMSGYDKGKDPSDKRQQREIVRARKLLRASVLAQAAQKKRR